MDSSARLEELRSRWQHGQHQGQPPSAEELCRDCPELLSEVWRCLETGKWPELNGDAPPAEQDLPTREAGPGEQPAATPEVGGGPPTVDLAPPVAARGDLPRRAGRYLVQEMIAQGGMGAVLRVRDPDFQRTLAVKILLPRAAARPEARGRFLEEAKITAQLQHPGIPPVHELGTLDDGSPFFAMKLIQGRTLAALLKERALGVESPDRQPGTADLDPRLLGVFRQICQTVAYAHSRGILHRDLKPSNVMVGAFGEVQVMDWGLAKVLTPASGGRQPPVASLEQGADAPRSPAEQGADAPRSPAGQTQAGTVLGTPAYMAPEQARGEIRTLDERCDVFGLGAILCELLTGRPPFSQPDRSARLRAAAAGDLAEAFGRLDGCGAAPELVALTRHCLAPDPKERPPHAGEVAAAVECYEALVQERLRQAELQRAKALIQAEEERRRAEVERARAQAERRRRRATLLAATAALLLVCGAAAGALWYVREQGMRASRHELREQGLRDALGQARQARAELHARLSRPGGVFRLLNRPTEWLQQIESARFALQRAQDLAAGAEAPIAADLRQQLEDLHAQLGQDEAERGLALKLEKIREARSAVVAGKFDDALAEREYPKVFEQAGLTVVPGQEAALAARVRQSRIREQLLAALDDWAFVAWARGKAEKGRKHRQRRLEDLRRRLLGVARLADRDPWKDQVRDPALWDKPQDLKRLAEKALAGPKALSQVSPQMLELLGNLLGKGALAQRWLRQGLARHPADFWLNFTLGNALRKSRPQQAEGFFRTALAVRPQSVMAHNNLGNALRDLRDPQGAVRHYQRALELDPRYALAHYNWGIALRDLRDPQGAVQHYQRALELDPTFAPAHYNLGHALYEQKDLGGAVRHYRRAFELDPKHALAHINLGVVLRDLKDLAGAVRHYRKALDLDPSLALAHNNLGVALRDRKDLQGAVRHFQRALALDPSYAEAHTNLGNALRGLKDLKGAVRHYQRALELDPTFAPAHNNLGVALRDLKDVQGAVRHLQRAVELDPGYALAHTNLGNVLRDSKDLSGAVRHYRKALELDPTLAPAHTNLGMVLYLLRDLKGAAAACRQAIQADPRLPNPPLILGLVLKDQGDFLAATGSIRRALESLPPGHPLHSSAQRDLQHCQQLLALERRLAPVLRGEKATTAEQLSLAELCRRYKQRYAEAARLYTTAFADEPWLADDLKAGHRYHAACAAALAAGKGSVKKAPTDGEKIRLRQQALTWLRADLQVWRKTLPGGPAAAVAVRKVLELWRSIPDLAGVRDEKELGKLPAEERKAWQQLWADVDRLLKARPVPPESGNALQ